MVLKANRVIQIQCKAIEFFRLARIFFSLTFRVRIFFPNLLPGMSQNFFLKPLWARIFFFIQYKFGSQLYCYESVTKLLY